MRGAGRVGGQGFGVAQVGRQRQHLQGVQHGKGALAGLLGVGGFHVKRQHRTAHAGLLRHGQHVLRVAGQPGVMHPAHGGVVLQPLRQCQRLVRLGAHAQVQGFQALEHHPGVERCQRHAAAFEHRQKLLGDHCLAGAQGTRHDAALAVQILGARVHDDVSPKQHRALQRRRGKAVVQRQQGAGVVGNIGQRLDVAHLGEGVGGRLGKQQPGVAAHRGLPGGGVGL